MVLPLLFSLGLPALAGTGALGATIGAMGAPLLSGIGAGLGSFIQTGDLGEGIKTGLTSFLGGKLLSGLGGALGGQAASTSADALATGMEVGTPLQIPAGGAAELLPGAADLGPGLGRSGLTGFLQPATSVREAVLSSQPPKMFTNLVGSPGANLGARTFLSDAVTGATLPGVLPAAFIGQSMADLARYNQQDDDDDEDKKKVNIPMPRPAIPTVADDPWAGGRTGEGLYFNWNRAPAPAGYTPEYPYYYAGGGLLDLRRMQEGGEVEIEVEAGDDASMEANGMNEKDVITQAIRAIKGASERPEIALGMFVQKYGEDALRDLVERVQSGEFDETVAESEGMVRGPGDGMDDMVPATVEGEQDVLLADNEYIVPADVVSHLGNGSSDAGARELDRMLERVRKVRTGSQEQAPQIDGREMLPA